MSKLQCQYCNKWSDDSTIKNHGLCIKCISTKLAENGCVIGKPLSDKPLKIKENKG